MSIVGVASKLVSEAMLSLYPVFVKNIGLPLDVQMWSRFVGYVLISALFIDRAFVWKQLQNGWGAALAAVTVVHIYTSYAGFELLNSGNAYTIFYVYPLFILLLSGSLSPWIAAAAFAGVALLARKERLYGVAMTLGAALTEAFIYFIVLRLPTKNNWNHIFLSYFAGALLLTGVFAARGGTAFSDLLAVNGQTVKALGINCVLGLCGYYLRFFAISNLPTITYALLSNVGIMTSYFYGYYFNGDGITVEQVIGAVLVAGACLLAKRSL